MRKTTIFEEAYSLALKGGIDVISECDGLQNDLGRLDMRTVMHEMIRQQVLNVVWTLMSKDKSMKEMPSAFDAWRDLCELDMCKDLWTWIDSGLLLSDDILSDMGWNNFKEE